MDKTSERIRSFLESKLLNQVHVGITILLNHPTHAPIEIIIFNRHKCLISGEKEWKDL